MLERGCGDLRPRYTIGGPFIAEDRHSIQLWLLHRLVITLTMSPSFRIGALVLGAVLMLGAVLAPRLQAAAPDSRTGRWVRVAVAVAGAALLGWGLIFSLGPQSASQPAPAAASTPAPTTPVDLLDAASTALQACPRATAPPVPDGTTASREEMAAATAAFKSFDTATNSYAQCVDTTIERIANQYAGVASHDDLHSLKEFGTVAHNTAIDQEKAVADQFNAQIRAYKAKHPQS